MTDHSEAAVVERVAVECAAQSWAEKGYGEEQVRNLWKTGGVLNRSHYRNRASVSLAALRPGDRLPGGLVVVVAESWTCFHCGETFMEQSEAEDHFGGTLLDLAACQIKAGEERGLVVALRRAEQELERYRAEDSDKDRELIALAAKHASLLRQEEEKGYARGLADGRNPAMIEASHE